MTSKRERTRELILETALGLFRKRGFDATTMRDIAAAAGMALGAAYYHFRSKEALVMAYYERNQSAHEAAAHARFATSNDVTARLVAAFHSKLDVLSRDRKLLGAVFRSAGDPDDPLSVFGSGTAGLRDRSTAIFAEALAPLALPSATADILARALWLAHLGLLLYFLHDRSRGQARTRRLVDELLGLVAPALTFAGSPGFAPVIARVIGAMDRARPPKRPSIRPTNKRRLKVGPSGSP